MKNYLLTLIGLLFAIGLSAQTVKVTGTVLDEGRQPLLGVSIFVQSNRAHGTVTELNGRFTIDVAVGEKLVFSYMGFVNKTVLINKVEHDYEELFAEDDNRALLDPAYDYYTELVNEADLSNDDYLYSYGLYVGENERAGRAHLASFSDEEIQAMADTYTEGYRIGFITCNKDISKKSVVQVLYPLGFER